MAIPVTAVTEGAVPNERPALLLTQDTAASLQVTLKDSDGESMGLTLDHTVTLAVREHESSTSDYFSSDCTVVDEDTVQVPVTAAQVPYTGIWLGQFNVSDAAGSVIYRLPCYVEVAANLQSSEKSYSPLSIAELRILVRDRSDLDNSFLEEVEFSNTELAMAVRRPVEYWNESRPFMQSKTYTPATFPYRYWWSIGAIGELLRMAAHNLVRNRVPLNAGGVQMDSKARADMYLALSKEYLSKFEQWVYSQKVGLNLQKCWGRIDNPLFES